MKYFILWYRLDGADKYLLWYTGQKDGVVIGDEGLIQVFHAKKDLVNFAESRNMQIQDEEPDLHDLDLVHAWLSSPQTENVACSEFLAAWNLFVDVSNSVGTDAEDFKKREQGNNSVYDKLFWGSNLPSMIPESKRYTPKWSAHEIRCLKGVLLAGLNLFKRYAA